MTSDLAQWSRHFFLALASAVATLVILTQAYFFVQIAWWTHVPPRQTHFMEIVLNADQAPPPPPTASARKKKLTPTATPSPPRIKPLIYEWVPYEAIAPSIKRAVIASEDSRFALHEGIDWQGIEQAMKKNKRKGRAVAGGSTITQQLAKNLFLSGQRSYARKAQELAITKMLEFWMDKTRILETYLNVAQWGDHLYGVEAAARHYFGVHAHQLTDEQAARLAVLLPSPARYGKNIYSEFINARTASILARMPSSVLP